MILLIDLRLSVFDRHIFFELQSSKLALTHYYLQHSIFY